MTQLPLNEFSVITTGSEAPPGCPGGSFSGRARAARLPRDASGRRLGVLGGLLALAALAGCGAESSEVVATPYRPGEATLVGEQAGGELTQLDTACEELDCSEVESRCGDRAAADLIVDADGNVVDVICYKQEVNVDVAEVDVIQSAEAGNNTVLVLDDVDDGLDVEGDVTISGNNAIIYGSGPDTSVIGGTVDIQKNNAVVRGVRILEDVTITKNNAQLAFCVIEGDLIITGNNATLAECVVFGKVTLKGQNTVLVQNHFTQDTVSGFNLTCNGNQVFEDQDDDFTLDEADLLGREAVCQAADGSPEPQSEIDADASDAGVAVGDAAVNP
jgi:hypothetical protein